MAKKRTWEQTERKVGCDKSCKVKQVAEKKIEISKEVLDDWRITKNELVWELNEYQKKVDELKNELYTKQNFIKEQDAIISDMFDDLVDTRSELYWVKFDRNISIAINIVLVVALIIVCI